MSQTARLTLLLVLACWSLVAGAQPRMYKCKQANDTYSFQADPCAEGLPQQVIVKNKAGALKTSPVENASASVAATLTPTVTPILAPSTVTQTSTANRPSNAFRPPSAADAGANVPADTDYVGTTRISRRTIKMAILSLIVIAVGLLAISFFIRGTQKDVVIEAPIQWPMCCAKCGGRNNLSFLSASVTKTESVNPLLLLVGIIRSKVRRYTLEYPVCSTHAMIAPIASLIAGRIGILISLLVGGYLIGSYDSLSGGEWATMRVNKKLVTVMYDLLAVTWLLLAAWSWRWVPLRMSRWEGQAGGYGRDIVRLTFSSKEYAQKFTIANRNESSFRDIRRKAWYHPIHWSRLLLVGFIVFFFVLMFATRFD